MVNSLFSQSVPLVNHKISATVNPDNSELVVVDTLILPKNSPREFWLNAELEPKSLTKGISLLKLKDHAKAYDVGMDRDDNGEKSELDLNLWEIKGNGNVIVLTYKGKINNPVSQGKENYQRGFAQTPGIICDKGVYLAGSTYWVPTFENNLVTFTLTTKLPAGWKSVSIGKRVYTGNIGKNHIDTWRCNKPEEEIFLIAAKFYEYSYKMNNGVEDMAFLREPDEGLANKYLEVTEQYMNMDNEMLGTYPYTKFALVENFWETGYGMPSFTLLGEKIIRFPFILHSSYPHELLHNWWGNGVFVDFSEGNWCEGITAFMADHLIKEQHGQGEEYRRNTLQKFTNLVNPSNDFPLTKFVGRYDGPSEAIGYGKALMMWQMLRRKVGDKTFLSGMRDFYKNNKFRRATYSDIQKSIEKVSGMDLSDFFKQWTTRTGAPKISIKSVSTDRFNNQYRVFLTLQQSQSQPAFVVDIPVMIATKKGLQTFVVNMSAKEQNYQFTLDEKPLKLAVDPQYDVFRILDPNEVPPTLSKIWGSKNNIFVLPGAANKEQFDAYKKFAEEWIKADDDNFEIVSDKDLKELPKDKTVWILGFENKFAGDINEGLKKNHSSILKDSVVLAGKSYAKKNNSFVFTLFDKNDVTRQLIFIAFDNQNAIDGLVRKLPHYGKYSYLAFNGAEPTNIAKGEWPVLHSPMVKVFDPSGEKIVMKEPRQALGTLKPVFSEKRMMETIKFLSSKDLKGRGLGTPELEKAANYIAKAFKEAGLQPLSGSYFQKFEHKFKDKGTLPVINVVGIIPGTDPAYKDAPVVISAHYDHLGLGWPDVHKGDEGKIHPGADDNASGVAILIELARNMAKTVKPKRTIVFLACSGEEAGLIGSRYFVAHRKDYFKKEIFADVNLDTDGSLFGKKILVLNGNTAKEWKFIFMGTDYTTGIKSEVINKQLDASDQFAFIEQNIPAVQLFTGATENYHRPTDTYDKIDGEGLVKVATVAKEVIEYLADRTDPMVFTGDNEKSKRSLSKASRKNRKVATGTVPAFAYTGKGVKIGGVIPGSPAEKAGLKKGDIIVAFYGKDVSDLRTYSDLLKQHSPGDVVKITVLRGKKKNKITVSLTLEAR